MCLCARVCEHVQVWRESPGLEKMDKVYFFLKSFQGLHQSSRIARALVGELQKSVIQICYINYIFTDSPRNPLLVLLIFST